MARYTGYTIDMGALFYANTHEELADLVLGHLKNRVRPRLGYTYDSAPQIVLRYTFWDLQPDGSIYKVTCKTSAEIVLLYRLSNERFKLSQDKPK